MRRAVLWWVLVAVLAVAVVPRLAGTTDAQEDGNRALRVGAWDILVTGAEMRDRVGTSAPVEAGGDFVVVAATATNLGTAPAAFDPARLRLADGTGLSFEPDREATRAAREGLDGGTEAYRPGEGRPTAVVFDVVPGRTVGLTLTAEGGAGEVALDPWLRPATPTPRATRTPTPDLAAAATGTVRAYRTRVAAGEAAVAAGQATIAALETRAAGLDARVVELEAALAAADAAGGAGSGAATGGDPAAGAGLTLAGFGGTTSEPFTLRSGDVRFSATHDGPGAFVVEFFTADGSASALVIDAVGPFAGEGRVNIDASPTGGTGTFYLAVRADGNWTITIDQ